MVWKSSLNTSPAPAPLPFLSPQYSRKEWLSPGHWASQTPWLCLCLELGHRLCQKRHGQSCPGRKAMASTCLRGCWPRKVQRDQTLVLQGACCLCGVPHPYPPGEGGSLQWGSHSGDVSWDVGGVPGDPCCLPGRFQLWSLLSGLF